MKGISNRAIFCDEYGESSPFEKGGQGDFIVKSVYNKISPIPSFSKRGTLSTTYCFITRIWATLLLLFLLSSCGWNANSPSQNQDNNIRVEIAGDYSESNVFLCLAGDRICNNAGEVLECNSDNSAWINIGRCSDGHVCMLGECKPDDLDINIVDEIDSSDDNASYIFITSFNNGDKAVNPVSIEWIASSDIKDVWIVVDKFPLQEDVIPASNSSYKYRFKGVDVKRHLFIFGIDKTGKIAATDNVFFTPIKHDPRKTTQIDCKIPDQSGFNHYTIGVINNHNLYPKNGTYPYCWEVDGDTCGGPWGIIHETYFAGEQLFEDGEDCFCSGHTLEIFLAAYSLWQQENDVDETVAFTVGNNRVTAEDVDPTSVGNGQFYEYWQGYGSASRASSADAFEKFGIGELLDDLNDAQTGDYINFTRTNNTGHATIFINWIIKKGKKIGFRYYGCNRNGEMCPNPNDSRGVQKSSGPSFKTEYFKEYGGTVIKNLLFIGRVYEPDIP